jgi:hypothetical protein
MVDCEHVETRRGEGQGGKQWIWGKGRERKEPGNMGKG